MLEHTFEPERSNMAWPPANPDQISVSFATPSGNGVTSVVDPYLHTHSTVTLAKLVKQRNTRTRYELSGSFKRLSVIEGQNICFVDEVQDESPQPRDTVLSDFTEDQSAPAGCHFCTNGAPPGMGLAGALSGTGAQPPIALHQQLRDSQVEGVGVYEGRGAEPAAVFWESSSDSSTVAASAKRHPGRLGPYKGIGESRSRISISRPGRGPLKSESRHAARHPGTGAQSSHVGDGACRMGAAARVQRAAAFASRYAGELATVLLHDAPNCAAQLAQHPNLIYDSSASTWPVQPRSPGDTLLRNGQNM